MASTIQTIGIEKSQSQSYELATYADQAEMDITPKIAKLANSFNQISQNYFKAVLAANLPVSEVTADITTTPTSTATGVGN